MAKNLPLLVFPQARVIPPPVGRRFPMSKPHFPEHGKQIDRLTIQIANLEADFDRYSADISGAVAGMEPESVLVIEIAGRIDEFKHAVEAAGLEWLGEWDLDEIEPNDEFYELNSKGEKAEKKVTGRLFLSLINETGLREILVLWAQWKNKKVFSTGLTKWRDVFSQIVLIRRWGIEETLGETGMIERWRELLDPVNPAQNIRFQIEFFYRANPLKRRQCEGIVSAFLAEIGGRTLGSSIDNSDISFHAVKAEIPANMIQQLLAQLNAPERNVDIHLFKFSSIMYFRPTGQSLAVVDNAEGEPAEFIAGSSEMQPVAAILDGVPNVLHDALKGRILLDDPDNLEERYQRGERRHGSSMASLVVHGELDDESSLPLVRLVYHRPIMQPNPNSQNRDEHVPDDVFLEDRIHVAVRRMFERQDNFEAQAPKVKVINLSIGDSSRPFVHTPSPLARLLDWLSWKYRVLFCVSAGNFADDIDLGMTSAEYLNLSDNERIIHVLKCIERQLSERRLLSPAEAMNVLTIGALHRDESGDFVHAGRTDLLPEIALFSPASRLGNGFRKSIKPEIFFPGGRQLYNLARQGAACSIDEYKKPPGQKVAWDSTQEGELSRSLHTRGTSNATALATRGGVLIHDVLQSLQESNGAFIKDNLIAIMIKTLLVHGARHDEQAKSALVAALKTPANSRKMKEVLSRYMGYGATDIQRVLTCTEQRGTVLGCGEILANEMHEYRFPLPSSLASRRDWRRLIITLAWFSPINPDHRNLREAKLELAAVGAWDTCALVLTRQDADHNQVHRGTVQHEILEGDKQIPAFRDGEEIVLHINCKADATSSLDDAIPYGLAVTLEVKDGIDIPIYQELRALIRPQVTVHPL